MIPGTYVAVGSDATLRKAVVAVSTDGVNWTSQVVANATPGTSFTGVTFANNHFVAVGGDRTTYGPGALTMTSNDDLTWDLQSNGTKNGALLLKV